MSKIWKIGRPCPSCELKDQNLVMSDSFWCEHSDRLTRLLDTVRMSRQNARRGISRFEELLGSAKAELSEARKALKVANDALSAKSEELATASRSLFEMDASLGRTRSDLTGVQEVLEVTSAALTAKSEDLMSLEGQLTSTKIALADSKTGLETAERHIKRLKRAAIVGWILIVPAAILGFFLH